MKDRFRNPSVLLCASTVLTALLMCLLNGEHYAGQLESAWPVSRPVAAAMSKVSEWSLLPKVHGLYRDGVDACCAWLWSGEDGSASDLPSGLVEREPAVSEPLPPPEFCGFHEQWLGKPEPVADAFCGFHQQWLGKPEESATAFCGFRNQWRGKAEAEKLVNSCPVTCRVMLMGDSLMEDFGVYFYRLNKARHGLQMILLAKFSTGLCRPDYFNWFELFPQTVAEKQPHIVLFMMGANDGQPVWYSREKIVQTKPAEQWKNAYGERVGTLLADARNARTLPLWVGMPVMGGKYAALLAQTETATREACAKRGVPYVDNRALLADANGKYQSFMKNEAGKLVRIRRKDLDHMTPEGNRILLQAAMPDFEQLLRQHRLNHPELCVYPERGGKLAKPSLDVVIPYKPKKK